MSNTMTPKRAIEILKNLTYVKVLENNAHSNGVIHSESACKKDNEDLAAIQMAISALEYRIPIMHSFMLARLVEDQSAVLKLKRFGAISARSADRLLISL